MTQFTKNDNKALLILFKDIFSYYNANSLSKKLGISRIGSMKMLKKFEKDNVLKSEKIGKSIVYKPNLKYDYVIDLISFLLSDEANNFKRWKEEFKDLFKENRIIMLYGSTITNYSKAADIDVMIIRKEGESGEVHRAIMEKQRIIPKKIHAIDLSAEEFLSNTRERQKAIIDIIRTAIILYGQKRYVELINNVSSF